MPNSEARARALSYIHRMCSSQSASAATAAAAGRRAGTVGTPKRVWVATAAACTLAAHADLAFACMRPSQLTPASQPAAIQHLALSWCTQSLPSHLTPASKVSSGRSLGQRMILAYSMQWAGDLQAGLCADGEGQASESDRDMESVQGNEQKQQGLRSLRERRPQHNSQQQQQRQQQQHWHGYKEAQRRRWTGSSSSATGNARRRAPTAAFLRACTAEIWSVAGRATACTRSRA